MTTLAASYNRATGVVRVGNVGTAVPTGFVAIGSFEHPDPVYPGSLVIFHGVRDLLYKRSASNPANTASFPENITDMEGIDIQLIPTAVTAVTLALETLTVAVGAKGTLAYTVTPTNATNKNVTFSSNNEARIKVNSEGEYTAVGAGTAVITIHTVDGNKTDTLNVTVNA